ncbi:MAG: type II/IV secretion system protein, partial [Verrucomicrobiota bacterium]|nr:type II/IV secretion system protein [Verrucomicrobiota bacterium]
MQANENYVLDVLQDAGLVSRAQVEAAKARLNGTTNVVDVLLKDGVVSESDVARTLAAQAHMDWVDLSAMLIPPEVIAQVRAEDARRFKVIPIGFGETGLIIAVSDPLDIDTIDGLQFLLQREIELVCSSPAKVRQALIKYYGTADEASDVLLQQLGDKVDFGIEGGDLGDENSADAPIIRMVSMLLIEAHRLGASDVHLEP